MLIESLLWALLGDPVPSAAQRTSGARLAQFRGSLSLSPAAALALIGAAAAISSLFLQDSGTVWILVAAFGAASALRMQQTFRRICHLDHRRYLSFVGSVIYGIVLVGGLLVLRDRSEDLPAWGLLALWAGALATNALLAVFLLGTVAMPDGRMVRASWARLLRIGAPLVPSALLYWISSYGIIPFVGAVLGPTASGAMRLVFTFLSPLFQTIAAVSSVALPMLAKALRGTHVSGKSRAFAGVAFTYLAIFVAYILFGALVLPAASGWILTDSLMPYFTSSALALVIVLALADVIRSAGAMVLLAIGSTKNILIGWFLSSLVTFGGSAYVLAVPSFVAAVSVLAASNVVGALYVALRLSRN